MMCVCAHLMSIPQFVLSLQEILLTLIQFPYSLRCQRCQLVLAGLDGDRGRGDDIICLCITYLLPKSQVQTAECRVAPTLESPFRGQWV